MNKEYELLLNDFQSFMDNFDDNMNMIYNLDKDINNYPIKTIIKYIILNKYNDNKKEHEYFINLLSKAEDKELFFLAMFLYYDVMTKTNLHDMICPVLNLFDFNISHSYSRIFIDTYLIDNFDIDPNKKLYNDSEINYILTFNGMVKLPPIIKKSYFINDDAYCIYLYKTGRIDGEGHFSKDSANFFNLDNVQSLYREARTIICRSKHTRRHLINLLLEEK